MKLVESFVDRVPFDELQKIGLTKSAVLRWPQDDITRLMSGQRTSIMPITVSIDGRNRIIEAKLLLKETNGQVSLNIVPVRRELKNDYGLKEQEKIKLYVGKLVVKNIDGERYLLQLDRETNEILRAKTSEVKLPFELRPGDREKLFSGKFIDVETTQGVRSIRIDLLNRKRFSFADEPVSIRYVGACFLESQLKKEDIARYNLSESDIHRLLDGYKTRLLDWPDGSKGKLGLKRNENGSASLERFPVKNELNNDIQMNEDQIERLKRGELVSSSIGGTMYLVQLDKETNEFVRKQQSHVLPDIIRGVELKADDKERLIAGQSVLLKDSRNDEPIVVRIDLSHISGLEIKDDTNKLRMLYAAGQDAGNTLDKILPNEMEREKFVRRNNLDKGDLANYARAAFDERQKFTYDLYSYSYSSYIQTDRNKWESMVFTKTQQTPIVGMKL